MASKNARRRFDDPVLRAVVLTRVFGKGWHHVVEQHYRGPEPDGYPSANTPDGFDTGGTVRTCPPTPR